MDGNGETPMFHVMIWFITQLKQSFKTDCLEFQVDIKSLVVLPVGTSRICFFDGPKELQKIFSLDLEW